MSEAYNPAFEEAFALFPDCTELLLRSKVEGSATSTGDFFGLTLMEKRINLGTVVTSTVPVEDAESMPEKFRTEEYQNQLPRILVHSGIELRFSTKTLLKHVTILGYTVLPKKEGAPSVAELMQEPQITVLEGDAFDELGRFGGVELMPGDQIRLQIKLRLPGLYKGFLSKWIVLAMLGKHSTFSPLQQTESTFLVPVKINANFVTELAPVKQVPMSIDARPFVPVTSLNYFSNPVPTFGGLEIDTIDGCTMFQIPANMKNVLLSVASKRIPFPQNIAQIRDIARKPPATSEERIYQNGFLAWVEEDKMLDDIRYFDAQNITLTTSEGKADLDFFLFKEQFPVPGDRKEKNLEASVYTLLLTFTVVGSNESRPKVVIGDKIRLRPTMHSLYEQAKRYRPLSPQVLPFELIAVVQSFELKSETVVCEVPLSARSCLAFLDIANQVGAITRHADGRTQMPGMHRGQSAQLIKFLDSLSYQVRFSFDTTGLSFCHEALQTYIGSSMPEPSTTTSLLRGQAEPGAVVQPALRPLDLIYPHPEHFPTLLPAMAAKQKKIRELLLNASPDMAADYNQEQMESISTILSLYEVRTGLPPYCIYGPPGTGKTKCLVGSLIQIIEMYPGARILATAPSDAAADVLALRLAKHFDQQALRMPAKKPLGASQMLRLNWYNRVYDSVPIQLLNYCHIPKGGKLFDIPLYDVLKMYRIIVATCGAAGCLRHNQATMYDPYAPHHFSVTTLPLDFDFVFVDEASQCTEAEALIPVSLAKRPSGVVVLAGDPKQLGPSTRSAIFRECGAESLLERLLSSDMYAGIQPAAADLSEPPGLELTARTEQPSFQMGVMLVNNYRSHRALLDVPSRLFYGSALREATKDRLKIDRFLLFTQAVCEAGSDGGGGGAGAVVAPSLGDRKGFPAIFYGVDGEHDHLLDSPSFFNVKEIEAMVELCKRLVTSPELTGGRLLVSDIGIIGAFRAQVLQLRLALRKESLAGISVGSVEYFQGQEKQVILISTVLCSKPPILSDKNLGLINDARRFNVAVTRGMGLCIVVGCPAFLHRDPFFREWIENCELHGRYAGAPCSLYSRHKKEEEEEVDLLNLAAANPGLEDVEAEGEGIVYEVSIADQMWRSLL